MNLEVEMDYQLLLFGVLTPNPFPKWRGELLAPKSKLSAKELSFPGKKSFGQIAYYNFAKRLLRFFNDQRSFFLNTICFQGEFIFPRLQIIHAVVCFFHFYFFISFFHILV